MRLEVSTLAELLLTTKDGDWGIEFPQSGYLPYRVIRGTDFESVRFGDLKSVPLRYLNKTTVARRTLKENDILFETAGGTKTQSTGRSMLVTSEILDCLDYPATCASFARFLRIDPKKALPQYIFWYFQNEFMLGHLWEYQVQHTGVARFQYTAFANNVEIPLPEMPQQRAIASILGSLDEKIKLNRKTCETLEEMARAIFKSWFVDFDPVRAKMAGEKPASICKRLGLTREILNLFPNKLVRSESGEIPEGWNVVPLNDLARLSTESISPSDYPDEFFDHYSIPAFDLNMLPAKDLGHDIKSNKYIVIRDSVLVSKLNPETPRAWMPIIGTAKAVCSTEFMQFVPKNHKERVFLYGLLTSAPVQEAILCRITGSTGSRQRAQPLSVAAMYVLAPSSNTIQAYCAISAPLYDAASKRRTESRVLASVRDELLPKLISGEIEAPIIGGKT